MQTHLQPDNTLPPELVMFLTTGMVGHPSAWLPEPSEQATFHWDVRPPDGFVTGKLYMDGSQRDSEAAFCGCCACQG